MPIDHKKNVETFFKFKRGKTSDVPDEWKQGKISAENIKKIEESNMDRTERIKMLQITTNQLMSPFIPENYKQEIVKMVSGIVEDITPGMDVNDAIGVLNKLIEKHKNVLTKSILRQELNDTRKTLETIAGTSELPAANIMQTTTDQLKMLDKYVSILDLHLNVLPRKDVHEVIMKNGNELMKSVWLDYITVSGKYDTDAVLNEEHVRKSISDILKGYKDSGNMEKNAKNVTEELGKRGITFGEFIKYAHETKEGKKLMEEISKAEKPNKDFLKIYG